MIRKSLCLGLALAGLCSAPVYGQQKSPRDKLYAAHAQYYTPTASGLKSFHCDAAIDWKAMLTHWSGKEIQDDNPALKFLQAVHLSVTDDLRGGGSLGWTSDTAPPDGKEESMKRVEEGLQTSVAGFFQSWNAYMNGSMVPLPDSTVALTPSDDGIHLSGAAKEMMIDEDFDKNMLLTKVLVVTPALRVLAMPTYVPTEDGLLVTSVKSLINQPPTAPQTEATIHVDYANVDSFRLPSHIVLDIKNTGVIEIALSGCHAATADWAKKR